eukprot:15361071-Ditylum_brightwellii.AAC.1
MSGWCFSIPTFMKTVDTKLTIMSSVNSDTWKSFQAIPKGDEFTKAFDLCQEPTGKQKTCIRVFLTIIPMLCLNTNKFDTTIYNKLLKHNLYIKPDIFEHNNLVSPEQITCQHPKLILQEDFIVGITDDIGSTHPLTMTSLLSGTRIATKHAVLALVFHISICSSTKRNMAMPWKELKQLRFQSFALRKMGYILKLCWQKHGAKNTSPVVFLSLQGWT